MLEVNKIYNMDCIEGMKMIPNGSIDLTVTSPPYDNLRTYNWYSWDFEWIAKELYRITKDWWVVVWVVWDATVKWSETGTSFKQALYFKEIGFNLHDTMIWEKTGQGAVGSNYCYWQNFEYMFVFSKGRPKSFNPICDRDNKITGKQTTSGGRNKDGVSTYKREIIAKPLGRRFNNWRINQETKQEHPAPFPEKLAEDHILSWSNEGDVILDPMAGSGTTLKMAKKNNRNYIGIEISQEYVDIANKRLQETQVWLF